MDFDLFIVDGRLAKTILIKFNIKVFLSNASLEHLFSLVAVKSTKLHGSFGGTFFLSVMMGILSIIIFSVKLSFNGDGLQVFFDGLAFKTFPLVSSFTLQKNKIESSSESSSSSIFFGNSNDLLLRCVLEKYLFGSHSVILLFNLVDFMTLSIPCLIC